MTVDQATLRRTRRLGLTAHDASKAFQGYTLLTPTFGDGTVYLLDMEGNEMHQWKMPYPPGAFGYLLPNGHLFYLGKTPERPPAMFFAWPIFDGGTLMEVDWDGNVLWEHRDPTHHHDGRRTESGGAVYLAIEHLPEKLAAQVQGGLPGTEHDGRMWVDRVVEVDAAGKTVWEWHAWEHLDPEIDVIAPTDLRDEWTHGNTVVPLPGGDVMASFRNISTVVRINRATGELVWKLGPDLLAQQHDPSLLPNGNVLLFNNGTRRLAHPLVHSSVMEIEPESGRIVWEYRDQSGVMNFYSAYISSAQRLPNGNTLICEGQCGRIFEVTPEHEIVWEYTSPHFFQAPVFGVTNAVFRAFRYGPERFQELA